VSATFRALETDMPMVYEVLQAIDALGALPHDHLVVRSVQEGIDLVRHFTFAEAIDACLLGPTRPVLPAADAAPPSAPVRLYQMPPEPSERQGP
jgi:hypothetical protein